MTTDRNSGLLPCPFCGGAAAVKHTYQWWVECQTCGVATPDRAPMDQSGVVAEWNRRVTEPSGPGYLDLTEAPPASVPVAGLEALVGAWRKFGAAESIGDPTADSYRPGYAAAADELAQLIQEAK